MKDRRMKFQFLQSERQKNYEDSHIITPKFSSVFSLTFHETISSSIIGQYLSRNHSITRRYEVSYDLLALV